MKLSPSRLPVLLCAGIAAIAGPAAAKPGDLDPTFGNTAPPFPPVIATTFGIVVQSDGKIVGAGLEIGANNHGDFSLTRFRTDGTPDPDFGIGGKVTNDFGDEEWAKSVALQADGKIVAAGPVNLLSNADPAFGIVRYLPNGSLDSSFGGTGKVTAGVAGMRCSAEAVAVLSGGKILVSGNANTLEPSRAYALIYRLNPDGTTDTVFGNGGRVLIPWVWGEAMALQGDGKIIMAGSRYSGGFWMARFDANGTLDPSFGNRGMVKTASLTGQAESPKLALQNDGKIVVAGTTWVTGPAPFGYFYIVARYNADGSPDLTFNGTGMVITDPTPHPGTLPPGVNPTQSDDFAHAVTVQSDGKVVVAGMAERKVSLVRYHRDGRLDASFGSGGIMVGAGGGIDALALQPDGKIVTGGDGSSHTALMALGRYIAKDNSQPIEVEWPAGTIMNNGEPVDLGSVIRGSEEKPETTITIRNTGTTSLTNISTRMAGNPGQASHFTVSSPPATTLSGGGSTTTFTVRFTPDPTVSNFQAPVVITANTPEPLEFAVTLFGATRSPEAVVALLQGGSPVAADSTVDFGLVPAGAGNTRIFTIKNTGNIELTVQGITLGVEGSPGDFTAGTPAPSVVPAKSSATFPVTFSPAGEGPRTARLRIASTDTYSAGFEINLTGTLATALQVWRQTYFGSWESEESGADLDDPDGDGIPNILEFATFTNPVEANAPSEQLIKNGNLLEYTFTRPLAATADLTYGLEWSDTPDGSWSKIGVAMSILSEDGAQQRVKYSLGGGSSGNRFVRLRVTRR